MTGAVIGTCVWAGVDSAWEQEKLEARKMLVNRAESHTSGARFVVPLLTCMTHVFQSVFYFSLHGNIIVNGHTHKKCNLVIRSLLLNRLTI